MFQSITSSFVSMTVQLDGVIWLGSMKGMQSKSSIISMSVVVKNGDLLVVDNDGGMV